MSEVLTGARQGGRRRKIKRDVRVTVRYAPHERDALEALADRQGLDLSELIRDLTLDAIRSNLPEVSLSSQN